MLGRKVGSSLLRLPLYARLPFRPAPFQSQNAVIVLAKRSYASPGRPRKTVGEPSKPVKRAAKKTAKATNDTATKQVKAKKKTAATKKAKAKPKPKKRTRKELTEEQKAAASVRLAKAKITDLKKAALKPPSVRAVSAYNAYCKEKLTGVDGDNMRGPNRTQSMRDVMRPVVEGWKSLSPAELEHYNHLAHTQTEANSAAYKRWVQSHTPEQIQLANRARMQLRRKLKDQVKGNSKYQPIKDERLVKRPATQFIQFSVNRQASGDFKNIPISERMKLISQEWKALNAGEKKKYEDLQKQDINRYSEEYNSVFGHMPGRLNGAQQVAAAA